MTASTTSTFFESAFETLARRIRDARTRRTQQLALASLRDMDAHQLDDLGLSVGDVLDALNAPRRLRQCSTPAASAARPAGLRIAPPP